MIICRSNYHRYFKKLGCRCKLSVFVLAVFLTTVGVLVTSHSIEAIAMAISTNAAKEMAEKITHIMSEKTTLLIRNSVEKLKGVATASQAGLLIGKHAPLPYQDPEGDNWYTKWQTWGTMYFKTIGVQAHMASFIFDDGSYLSVGGGFSPEHYVSFPLILTSRWKLGDNTPTPHDASPIPSSTVKYEEYLFSSMRLNNSYTIQEPLDPRQRPHFNRSLGVFEMSYGAVSLAINGRPVVLLSYSMYNASRVFLGVGEARLLLDSFDDLVEAQRPTPNSHVFILDRDRNLIASSVPSRPAFESQSVPSDYKLSGVDEKNGCMLTSAGAPDGGTIRKCRLNPFSFGFEPLKEMLVSGLIPPPGDVLLSGEVQRAELGDLGHFYTAVSDYNSYFPTLDWISVVLIPEEEVLTEIQRGNYISLGVSWALSITVATIIGLLMRLFLKPLADIAERMRTHAYLEDSSSSDSPITEASEDGGTEYKATNSSSSSDRKKTKRSHRVLSRLSDVAAIQSSYWAMLDELRLLRGYIPEHVRNQLIQSLKPPPSATDLSDEKQIEMVTHEVSTSSSSDSQQNLMDNIYDEGGDKEDHKVTHVHPIPDCTETNNAFQMSKGKDTEESFEFTSIQPNANSKSAPPLMSHELLPAMKGLVEREVAIVAINILDFHQYVAKTDPSVITKEHERFVSYLQEASKQHGGVLDTFNGDKFWVSFNAFVACNDIRAAATHFACEVAHMVAKESISYQQYLEIEQNRPLNKPPLCPKIPRTQIAMKGITIGISAGSALVGSLGTTNIRRHTITSNAIARAAALERLAARFPDCSIMVGEEIIPYLDGHFQYINLDATALPGSGGQRMMIACVKASLHSAKAHGGTKKRHQSLRNPYKPINDCFNAFLEGKVHEVEKRLDEIATYIDLSRQALANCRKLPDGRYVLTPCERSNISMMATFISSNLKDGKHYCSSLGNLFERPTQ